VCKKYFFFSDGYVDYVRHYLRAIAYSPELAPENINHILSSTSIINKADYVPFFKKSYMIEFPFDEETKMKILYKTFDKKSIETMCMTENPSQIL
jgi:hypothetical protein